MQTKTTSIYDIKAGDTVIVDGEWRTVDNQDIKNCPFMGMYLFGDASKKSYEVVMFPKFYKGKFLGHVSQP